MDPSCLGAVVAADGANAGDHLLHAAQRPARQKGLRGQRGQRHRRRALPEPGAQLPLPVKVMVKVE